ncbi:MAG TPA: c-type cytochrome [Chitinophagales bacterium]|nr:c-type cytochrome [Chitinophagales bacterium]
MRSLPSMCVRIIFKSRFRRYIASIFILLFFISSFSFAEVTADNGQKLFKQYCTSCHAINNKLVGPALKDVHKKQTEEWLIKWIRNNSALRASGDKDALAIYAEYNKNEMPSFLSFTDDDIKSIIEYVKVQSEAPVSQPGAPAPGTEGAPSDQPSFWLYIVVGVLLIITFLLMRTNTVLKRLAYEKLGETLPEERPLIGRLKTKRAIAFYAIAGVFLLGFTITDSAMRLGRSKNYTPVQPIAFSHQLHAGINQINCLYCHSSAEKSKIAGIPPVSTCMNCHKAVQQGENEAGTKEIQKIYAAFDKNEPIQWTKIHNLPDHVYFNHSQHVAVGKIACQTCHGPIETMKEVYQFSSLSMGWCINCHRQTGVQFGSNDYYSMYSKLHEDFKSGKIDKVTEEMMGGTECQKCHY